MRSARRPVAVLVGGAVWTALATSSAYASMLPDPDAVDPATIARSLSDSSGGATGKPLWEYAASGMLVVLLTLAVVGLVTSLRHPQRHPQRHPRRSQPRLHA